MHAEIAAAVAREHTPGLSSAAATRLEELLGRSPSVLELEVYAALLRGRGVELGAGWPLRVELATGDAVALTVASGAGAGTEAALGLKAAGIVPATVVLTLPGAGDAAAAATEQAEVVRLGLSTTVVATPEATAITALAIGLAGEPAAVLRDPAAGDALIYLGAPTGREGLGGGSAGGFCPTPGAAVQTETMALLRALQAQPGLVLRARLVGKGGLAQAAAGLKVGCQLLLDAVPRHPVVLHPKELLLAETASRALIVVPAERVEEVLAAGQGVGAATIGSITAEDRLSVVMKPRGATAARPICELPLRALHDERATPPSGRSSTDELPAVLLPAEREPGAANPLLLHLRAAASPSPSPVAILHPGPPALLLAVRVPAVGSAVAAQQALAAAASAVYATGATPSGAVWLRDAAPESAAAEAALRNSAAVLGIGLGSARSEAVPAGGLMLVMGQDGAADSAVSTSFRGPGFLVAVLGFDGGDEVQVQAAGALCGELIHGGLCATAQAIGSGGLLLALARACADGGIGCTAVLPAPVTTPGPSPESGLEVLFRAEPGRYLVAIPAHRQAEARLLASDRGVPLWPLGRTGGSELLVRRSDGPAPSPFIEVLRLPVAVLAAELKQG